MTERTSAASTVEIAAARHRDPGGCEPVGELERERVGILAIDGDDELVALVLVKLLAPRGNLVVASYDQDAERRRACGHRGVELVPGVALRELLVLALEDDPARGGAIGRAESRPGRRPSCRRPRRLRSRCGSRNRCGPTRSARPRRRPAPRRRSPCGCRPPRPRQRARRRRRARAGGRAPCGARRPAPCMRACLLRMRVAKALDLGAVALLSLEHRLAELLLDADQRVRRVLGRKEPGSRPRAARACSSATISRTWRLHGLIAVECFGELLGDRLRALFERAFELFVELAEAGLQLAAHVIDVDRRLLGVEDAGADLDRLADRVGRGRAGLRAARGRPRRRAGRRRSAPSITMRSPSARTVPDGIVAELKLWFLRGFHSGFSKVVAPSDGFLTAGGRLRADTLPRPFRTTRS